MTARSVARRVVGVLALALAAAVLLLAGYLLVLLPSVPDTTRLRQADSARPSVLVSVDGQPLSSFSRTQREQVALDQVSPHVLQALLATEDHRFYGHHGIDPGRTVMAVLRTLSGDTQGGSTITQQLARNLFPEEIGRRRSVHRKLKEMLTALRIERQFSKEWILEAYLNSAPYLYNVVGIEMAARTYYDKSASELDVLESATLIGMLKGAAYYNPVLHPERARSRRNVVLAQMARHGALSEAQWQHLRGEPLLVKLNRQPDGSDAAPHFVQQARQWLVDWAREHGHDLYADGLVVQTTLDSRLQGAAARAIAAQLQALQAVADVEWSQAGLRIEAGTTEVYQRQRAKVDPFAYFWKSQPDLLAAFVAETPDFRKALAGGSSAAAASHRFSTDADWLEHLKRAKSRLEAGFMAIDPASGEIRAWVGSRDFDIDQYDHVVRAERQPGSTFKPFVYGAALESGIDPDRTYVDSPMETTLADGKRWRPTDMQTSSDLPMTLRDGLALSKNTITVQVSRDVGIPRIAALAQAMGVNRSKLDPVPSLALGTSPVTLYEMVNAYATIARQGQYLKPLMIKRISDRHGTVLAEFGAGEAQRAMAADNAVELIDMLRGVVSRGTGTWVRTRFGIQGDVAGKTGTTQNNTDGWFILMHPRLVAGAWVGFNDARVTMRSSYWGQGGHNAVLVVGDFFRAALKDGLVDAKASFPASRRPPPPAVMPAEEPPTDAPEISAVALETGAAPPKSADELEQAIRAMASGPPR